MFLDTEDTVIFSDTHGQAGLVEKVVERYPGVRMLSAGDVVDGEDTRALLELMGEYGIKSALGNHEVILLGSILAIDDEERDVWQDMWRHNDSRYRPYEYRMLRSYGIDEGLSNEVAAEELLDKLDYLGHLSLLQSFQPYFETDDFVVVHGGLTDEPWEDQRTVLDKFGIQASLRRFADAPEQIMDRTADLANGTTQATEKTVLSGHAHMLRSPERVIDGGKRVRLASRLATGAPLHVYQTWDNQVVTIK